MLRHTLKPHKLILDPCEFFSSRSTSDYGLRGPFAISDLVMLRLDINFATPWSPRKIQVEISKPETEIGCFFLQATKNPPTCDVYIRFHSFFSQVMICESMIFPLSPFGWISESLRCCDVRLLLRENQERQIEKKCTKKKKVDDPIPELTDNVISAQFLIPHFR